MIVGPLLLAMTFLLGLTPEEWRDHAETAFREGVRRREDSAAARPYFAEAARSYRSLRLEGADSAELFRNEGRAYFLAGDLPRAVLAFRLGLERYPADRELRDLLTLARRQVAYPAGGLGQPPVERRPPWLPRLTPGALLVIGLALYALACVAVTRWRMTRRPGLLPVALVALVLAGLLAGGAWALHRQTQNAPPLVVVAEDNVLLRKGDGLAYPVRHDQPLQRGIEARLLFQRGDWVQIELAGGEVGWLKRNWVLIDRNGEIEN